MPTTPSILVRRTTIWTKSARCGPATVGLKPLAAAELGVGDGEEVAITSRRNTIRIAVRLSERVARKQVFIPMHYREAAANLLTNPALDGPSGIPEFKVCAVRVEAVKPALV